MKLYYFESPNPRKACAVAKHLKLSMEFERVDLPNGESRTTEYLAINPNGKVPALIDGELVLWESHAIMMYLSNKAGSDLWPEDKFNQIEVMRWLAWDLAHFTRHAGTLIYENHFKPNFSKGTPDAVVVKESTDFLIRYIGVLNQHLKNRNFLVNENLSIADFAVATILPNAKEAKLPLEGADEVIRWHNQMMEIPAWRDPWPTHQQQKESTQ